jgi:hypothetical protein
VFAAALQGHDAAIRALCELGADVNTPDTPDVTPVSAAAHKGHVKAIRLLCELGADINTSKNDGISPLLVAAKNGHQKVVKLFRKLGENMNEESIHGMTPLCLAQAFGHPEVAAKLTKYTACCACCQKQGTADVKLLACSRCLKTYYCSAECSKQDWKQHKQTCAAAAAADEA